MTAKVKTPLGDKASGFVYNIPCKCDNTCTQVKQTGCGEPEKHYHRVRLTTQDIENGLMESAQRRMDTEDGGLAKHASVCPAGINWERGKITGREPKWTQ